MPRGKKTGKRVYGDVISVIIYVRGQGCSVRLSVDVGQWTKKWPDLILKLSYGDGKNVWVIFEVLSVVNIILRRTRTENKAMNIS